MAFPTTPVLDQFNDGVSSSPPNSNWTNGIAGTGALTDVAGTFTIRAVAANGTGYWNAATFGPDAEAYISNYAVFTSGQAGYLYARLASVGSAAVDGYAGSITNNGGTGNIEFRAYRLDNGVLTQLGATATETYFSDTTRLGLEIIGSTINVYYNNASPLKVSRSDGTYTAAGRIGFGSSDNTSDWHTFGGGNFSQPATENAPVATATAEAPAPTITGDVVMNATVDAPVAEATADAPAPTILVPNPNQLTVKVATQDTEQTTTSTTFSDVCTISASEFVAGHKYLIMASGQIGSSSTTVRTHPRLVHGATPTVFEGSDAGHRIGSTTAANKNDWDYFTVFTQPGTPEDIKIQFATQTGGTTARIDSARIVAIDLSHDNLVENTDWYFNENTTVAGHSTTLADRASVTVSANGTDEWLVIGNVHFLFDSTTVSVEAVLNCGGNTDASFLVEGRNTNDELTQNLVRPIVLGSGSQVCKIQTRDDTATAANDHSSSRVFAINLAKFENVLTSFTDGGSTTQNTTYATVSYTPDEEQQVVLIGWATYDARAASRTARINLAVDGTVIPTGRDSNNDVFSQDATDIDPMFTVAVAQLDASAHDIDLNGTFSATGSGANMCNRTLVAWGMITVPGITAVGDEITSDWHVRAAVNDSFISDWHVRTPLGDLVTADWRVRAIVGDETAVSWHNRAYVSDTAVIDWHTRAIVGNKPVNGHFEVNTNDWLPETGTTLTVEPEGFLGNSSMGIQQTGTTDRVRAYNPGTITGGTPLGTTYEVTAWVKAGNAAALGTVCEMVFWSIGGSQPQNVPLTVLPGADVSYFDDVVLTDDWQLLRIECRIEFADRTDLQIYLGATNFGGSISDGRKILADNIQIRETQLAVDQWDIRTAVGDEQAYEWNVAGVVSAVFDTLTLDWHVRSAVGDEHSFEWDTLAAIFDTVVVDWHTRLAVGNIPLNGSFEDGTTTGWFVNGDVSLSIENEGYAGEHSLGATLNSGPDWRVADYGFHIQNPPQGSKWQFRGRVKAGSPGAVGLVFGTTLYLVGGVNGPAHSFDQVVTYATLTEDWQEFGTIGSVDFADRTSGDIYFGPGYATGSPGDMFLVDALEIREVIEEPSQWNIAQAVGDQQAIDWNVHANLADQLVSDWHIRTPIADQFVSDWHIRTFVGDQFISDWNLLANLFDTLSVDWHTRMVVGNQPYNGSFETDLSNWFNNPVTISMTRVQDAHVGEYSLSMELIEDTSDFRVYSPGAQNLEVGYTYEARAWVKAGAPSTVGKSAALVLYFEGNTGPNHHAEVNNGVVLTDDWQEIISYGTVDAGHDHLQLAFYLGDVNEDFVVGDIILWDGIQIRQRIDRSSEWSVRTFVGDDQPTDWHTRSLVNDDQPTDWHVRAAIGDQQSADWHVRTFVGDDFDSLWNILAAVGDEQSFEWHLFSELVVGDQQAFAWQVRSLVNDEVDSDWHVRTFIGDQQSADWHIRSAVGDQQAYDWHTRAAIFDTFVSDWHVRALASDDFSSEWNIESFVAVAKQLLMAWHVRALAGDEQLADWHVRTFVGDEQASAWNILAVVFDTLVSEWHTREALGDQQSYDWHIRITVGDQQSMEWAVRLLVNDQQAMDWHVRSLLADEVASDWHVRSLVADILEAQWHTRFAVGNEQVYLWDVLFGFTVGVARVLAWHIRHRINDQQAFEWTIRVGIGDAFTSAWHVDGYHLTTSGLYVLRVTDDGRRIVDALDDGYRKLVTADDGRRIVDTSDDGMRRARAILESRQRTRLKV